ncbi:hypothetical protein P1X14_19260 [Sphingomonas sp. AOB5]|uniref:hypothetical protein n=1 Tax=Sphingomonas sp. AOB5 TaxID=3034017 RepID=UPI0023FA05EC|nr:hypothetical protein [Sphingomonas sp. AOB5]MDF7777404.1 hypothetical protein [Sphingomonas sp. AOB5]
MRLITAALAAVLLTPATAHAQDEYAALQSRIKSILEDVRVPQWADGSARIDITNTYSVTGRGCFTTIETAYPARTIRGRKEPGYFTTTEIAWGKIQNLGGNAANDIILYTAPNETPRSFYAGSRYDELRAAMHRLGRLCGGLNAMPPAPAPAPRPTPTPAPAPVPRPNAVATSQAILANVFGRTVTGATLAGRYIPDLTTYSTRSQGCFTQIFRSQRRVQLRDSYFAAASDSNTVTWSEVASVDRGPMAGNSRQPDAVAIRWRSGRVVSYNFNNAQDRDQVYDAMNALVVACR